MKYNNPPIQEAIFDIRIDKLTISSVDDFEKIYSQLSDSYPNKRKHINFTNKIEFKDNTQVRNEADSQVMGVIFSNTDNTRLVQFRLDGFTFNMVKPYTEWNHFSSEALRLWKIYSDNFLPNSIVRIAVRYINRISIPILSLRFQDYITNMPPIPVCLPQSFRNFFMQTEIPCDMIGTSIVITETIEPPVSGNLAFILDLDAYKVSHIENNISVLSSEFSKLRDLKNRTFENCITDKTRQLFN